MSGEYSCDAVELADRVAGLLEQGQWRLVLAESCTCGLVAATLGAVPGISSWLCGSAVTYREATKSAWLGVRPETLRSVTAVSPDVALQMACGALDATPEANWSASITGHLGPNAPIEQDGLVYIGVARRVNDSVESTAMIEHRLTNEGRLPRRDEAMRLVLEALAEQFAGALI